MKKISEHLGEIIVALACVALLITAITVFDAPVSGFFSSIVDKEVALGNQLLEGIENIDTSVGVGGSGSGSGGETGGEGEFGGEAGGGDERLFIYCYDATYFNVEETDEYGAIEIVDEGYTLSLKSDFKTALINNTDYVVDGKTVWTAGSALPELQSESQPGMRRSLSGMFQGCNTITSLDLTNWYTTNTKYMSNMFSGCSNLTSLDISSFNISNVTDMSGMFSGCNNLTSIIVRTEADKAKIEACDTFPSGCVVTVK